MLRKQPPGDLLPSAHAVDREYRVIKALSRTDVPVPKAGAVLSTTGTCIGTPFYLMERLRGRVFWDPTLPELRARGRALGIYEGMVGRSRAVCIWPIGPAIGLDRASADPGNYFARQIGRWSKQWEGSRTRDNPAIDKLAEWLPRHDSGQATTPPSATAISAWTT